MNNAIPNLTVLPTGLVDWASVPKGAYRIVTLPADAGPLAFRDVLVQKAQDGTAIVHLGSMDDDDIRRSREGRK